MRKGNLGEVGRGGSAFHAEVRGLAHLLNQPTGRVFGYGCDADLGDARCTVDLSSPTLHGSGTVASASDARRFTAAGLDAFANGWFGGGKLMFTSGANAGRAMEIKHHAVSVGVVGIALWQAMSQPIALGGRLHRHRRLRQAVRHLQGEVRQRRQFPRLPAHARQ